MARKTSPRDLVRQVAARGVKNKRGEYRPLTQKEIAKRAGVSERTVRRWKSGESVPSADAAKRLRRAADRAREANRALARRETGGRQPLPRDVPIPHAERRTLRTYRAGKWTGEYERSDWVNYNVQGYSHADVLDFIEAMQSRGASLRMKIQLIYLAPVEVTGDSGSPYSDTLQRIGTPIVDVGGRDPDQLRAFFAQRLKGKRTHPLYVAVLDVTAGDFARPIRKKRN